MSGEVLSRVDALKRRLDLLRPLSPPQVAKLREAYVVEWTHHSTALEGNTLSLVETRVVLEGLTVGGKTLREHLEVVDHAEAIRYVEDYVRGGQPLTEVFVRDVHRLVLRRSWPEEAGRYRRGDVLIAGSRHRPPPAVDIPARVADVVGWYRTEAPGLHPVERAALLHWKIAHVHPFADGNGRTARLLLNFSLMRDGFPPAILRFEDRARYLECLETASLTGDVGPFIQLVGEAVEASLERWLAVLEPSRRADRGLGL